MKLLLIGAGFIAFLCLYVWFTEYAAPTTPRGSRYARWQRRIRTLRLFDPEPRNIDDV